MKQIQILGITGSIRSDSSSAIVIREAAKTFPDNVRFTLYEQMADIPAFDGADDDPEPVAHLKKLIQELQRKRSGRKA